MKKCPRKVWLPRLGGSVGTAWDMGLTMSQRKAVTKAVATRYRSASKGAKAVILDELCATTWLAS